MAKNEDGEFELILGNNQLLSVFFLVVLLLALCFVGGYVVGRNAAPLLTADGGPAPSALPDSPKTEVKIAKADPPAKPEPPAKEPPQVKTAPQSEPETKSAPPTKSDPPKPAPPAKPETPKPAPVAARPSVSSQPVPGSLYLQLSAVDKDKAELLAEMVVRRANLPAIAAVIPEKPALYRVLVGPITQDKVADTKARLKAAEFPADDAFLKTF